MFNITNIKSGESRAVPYEKSVTELRAPTDDSVRLLNEFQREAFKNILEAKIIRDNNFEFSLLVYRKPSSFSIVTNIKFKLNEKEYSFDFERNTAYTAEEVLKEFYNKLAELIAEEITNGIQKQHIIQYFDLLKPTKGSV